MPLPPVDLWSLVLTARLNPAVAIVAVLMGRQADQWQKVPVAGFAAATIGSAVIYVLVWLGLLGGALGRAAAGVFIAQFLIGMVWAGGAYLWARR